MDENLTSENFTDYLYVDMPEAMWYYESSDSMWIYVSPFLIVLGLIGNVLAGTVFLTKGHRKSSIHLCLLVLTIVDTSLLIFGLGFKWIYYIFHTDVRAMSVAGCQFHVSLVYFLVHFEAWILVTVTIERYVAVVYPFQAKLWCRRRNMAIVLAVEFAVLFFINLHVFWTMELIVWEDGEITCEFREEMVYFTSSVWPWIDLVLSLFVPFLLMLIFNTIICYTLYKRRRLQRRLSTTSVSMTQSRTTVMLLKCDVYISAARGADSSVHGIIKWGPFDGGNPVARRQTLVRLGDSQHAGLHQLLGKLFLVLREWCFFQRRSESSMLPSSKNAKNAEYIYENCERVHHFSAHAGIERVLLHRKRKQNMLMAKCPPKLTKTHRG